jgi:MoaA/NifB/PqqE/SkfB family radical SAM enzyme
MGFPEEERFYPEEYVRSLRPINEELRQAFKMALPRTGLAPRVAYFKILDPCNKNCFYCDANQIKGGQMTTGEARHVLFNLAQVGIQMADLTGGEPTLRPDLPELVEYAAKELGMIVSLSSNGGINKGPVADYKYWCDLAEKGLFAACFSYDGVDPKADQRVIHLASFLSHQLHIMGGVRTVVWQENLGLVYDIAKECINNNIFYQAVVAVNKGGETSAQFTPLDLEGRLKFVDIIHQARQIRKPGNLLRVPDGYLNDIVATNDPNSWHCNQPSRHWLSVDAQGQVRVCNDVPLSQKISLKEDTNPLLQNTIFTQINQESEPCSGCSWLCHWEGNRNQTIRDLDYLRLYLTLGLLT